MGILDKVKSFDREFIRGDGFRYRVVYTLYINDKTYIKVPFSLSTEFVQDMHAWSSQDRHDGTKSGERMALESLDSMVEGNGKTLYRELRLKQLLEK
jgi:hypothetical protein